MTARLEGWCVRHRTADAWLAPECRTPPSLSGIVTGHPRKADGTAISTSPIAAVSGRIVTTARGTVYELGEPAPEYVDWMRENGIPFDPENPVKVRG